MATETLPPLGLTGTEAALVTVTDDELVRRLDAAISAVSDDGERDALFVVAAEVVERWHPAGEWAWQVAWHVENTAPERRRGELEAHREAMAKRAAARVMAFGEMGGRS